MDVDEPRGILGFWVGTLGRYTCPSRVLTWGRPAHRYSVHAEAPRACGVGMVWWLFVRARRRLRESPAACSYERARASVIGRVMRCQPVRSIADPRSRDPSVRRAETDTSETFARGDGWRARLPGHRALARGRALAVLLAVLRAPRRLHAGPLPCTVICIHPYRWPRRVSTPRRITRTAGACRSDCAASRARSTARRRRHRWSSRASSTRSQARRACCLSAVRRSAGRLRVETTW